ncbi:MULTISPECIES: LacI family DNA-binding transcriptional regulator [Lactobacillus]|uniref:LacI family DNA-binding transcriptional regulator n=1 Tax=Lactobacillus TaxID=1578 RepID=UPI001C6A399E|nr:MULTISPECIES: LacI family DNA-binding transcriptional regulator [Lactobacillus]MCX8720510.1 LacI family DNA-binding transcriptional regulator [Lactobacillus sp. B4010]MCX8723398.1 LacI family DNA-binding transcriptional regulator [Lactobacillus sp. B4005]MCX8731467.1 LacI family DNA-binding transcriptional regulator [Lactobacillus sp. B4015]MCX8733688.1 LacI family DNA-binding transcriptional regulator [Lactobacillus sp. B4012]QYN57213.1 LacI family transcriptional regulator [Lactobacillus 
MKTTIKDVAQQANVSIATVSRVINNNGYISAKTRKAVLEAIKESKYQVPIKKKCSPISPRLIKVILPGLNNPFYADFFNSLVESFNYYNYDVIFTIANNPKEGLDNYINDIRSSKVDGIVVSSHLQDSHHKLSGNLPIISFDRNFKNIIKIRSDNLNGGKKIAEKVLSLGKKNVLIISGDKSDLYPINDRIKGMLSVLNSYKVNVNTNYLNFNSSTMAKKIAIAQIINSKVYDAICCTDDNTALLVKQYTNSQNYYPLITGFDGTEMIRNFFPDLITIKQPVKDMTELIAEILVQKIHHPTENFKKTYTLPITLIS